MYVQFCLKNKWIISNIAFKNGLPNEIGLAIIPFFFQWGFPNSLPINSDPWSYVIYVGHGYLVIHLVSTKFTIVITSWSSYCVISNHPVTGFIIVTDFIFMSYLFPFVYFLWCRDLLYLHRFYSILFPQLTYL